FFLQVLQEFPSARAVHDVVTRHPIDTRGTLVLQHQPPRHRQHVEPIDSVIQGVKPKPRFLLGLSPQLPPQLRNVQDKLYAVPPFRFVRQFGPTVNGYLLRSGMKFIQAAFSSSCGNTLSAGLLRSTSITRLHGYYEPLRLPNRSPGRYLFRPGVDHRPTRRWSPARVSQVPDCSVDARCPLSPRRARPLHMFVASRSMAGFTSSGGLATPNCVTRPKRVHWITAGIVAFRGFGRRITPTPAQSATWRTNNFHD